MSDSMHQLLWEMRHFLTVSFTTFRDEECLFFSQFPTRLGMRVAQFLQVQKRSSIEDIRFLKSRNSFKAFLSFPKPKVRNCEVFVEYSQFRVRGKRMKIKHSQSITSLSWPKHVFECALPSWKSSHLTSFRTFLEDIDYRLLRHCFQRCGSKPAKTRLWVLRTFVKKFALEALSTISRDIDYRLMRNSFQRCSSKLLKSAL